MLYEQRHLKEPLLLGKIYFNLGAAHADNPEGLLQKASSEEDILRTRLRQGKVCLLEKHYEAAKELLCEIRQQPLKERLSMHADLLEAKLYLALQDLPKAHTLAKAGLAKAHHLGAKEDEGRFVALLKELESNPKLALQ